MKYSIRDLFLVTLIVALAVGWWVRERQAASQLERAKRWRNAAGTLEEMLRSEGYDVRWQFDMQPSGVEISRDSGLLLWHTIESSDEPSQDQLPHEMPGMPTLPRYPGKIRPTNEK